MIRLEVFRTGIPQDVLESGEPLLTLGRAHTNQIIFTADNVSSQHAQIFLDEGRYVYRDLNSTNGSVIVHEGEKILLHEGRMEWTLAEGDRVFLAGPDSVILIRGIELDAADEEPESDTILAEVPSGAEELEVSLGQDSEALRCVVHLAREISGLESAADVARLTCRTALDALPKARLVRFLVPGEHGFTVEHMDCRDPGDQEISRVQMTSPKLVERCMQQRKGFLFLIEKDRYQMIATRIAAVEQLAQEDGAGDRVLLCCPLFHGEQCHGFLEVEAPLSPESRQSLTRRDLSLVTLMGHLVADRLHDMAVRHDQLKLARKATAGFMAAMVGHCFKNLLFVPMSISKMLPRCLELGKMDEVNWMLARNSVSIRYLDILSNEFAAASKDPTEGFEPGRLPDLLGEVRSIMSQVYPDQITTRVDCPDGLPELVCHAGGLKRMLMNLTLNAVDAIIGAGQNRGGEIVLSARHGGDGRSVLIAVEDNGPGIPPAILENLRNIFQQVKASTDALGQLQEIAERVRSTKEQGYKEHYGLGFLFVCLTIHHHGGELAITSEPDKGARFLIMLPIVRPGDEASTNR